MKKITLMLLVLITGISQVKAYESFTVAGDAAMMGTSWDPSNTANDMTLKEGTTNIYTLTKTFSGDGLAAGTYEFKIAADHAWTKSWGKAGGSSNNYVDVADGCTSITFVFDANTGKNYAFTDKTVYSIQSDITGWSDHDMTRNADLYTYTFKVSDFDATATTYKYKVRFDRAWTHAIPQSGNKYYTIKEAAPFDFIFTLNKLTDELTLEAKRVVNIGAYGKATLASKHALDFANAEDADGNKTLKAYKVTNISKTAATLTEVSNVEYGNGVLLVGTPNTKYTVPFGDGKDDMSDNKLQAANNDVTVTNAGDAYILYNGEFHPANAGTIPAGRAYLLKADVPTEARSLALVFEGEATEINTLDNLTNSQFDANAPMYNLAGQRVNKSYKGVVIQNGKKIVRK